MAEKFIKRTADVGLKERLDSRFFPEPQKGSNGRFMERPADTDIKERLDSRFFPGPEEELTGVPKKIADTVYVAFKELPFVGTTIGAAEAVGSAIKGDYEEAATTGVTTAIMEGMGHVIQPFSLGMAICETALIWELDKVKIHERPADASLKGNLDSRFFPKK